MLKRTNIVSIALGILLNTYSIYSSADALQKAQYLKIRITLNEKLPPVLRYSANATHKESVEGSLSITPDLLSKFAYPLSIKSVQVQSDYSHYIKQIPMASTNKLARQLIVSYSPLHDPLAMISNLEMSLGIESAELVNDDYNGGLVISATPNDPLYESPLVVSPAIAPFKDYQSWFYEMMDMPHAWDYGTGHANVAIFDLIYKAAHDELEDGVRTHWSYDFVPHLKEKLSGTTILHGTHVTGLVGAKSNNGNGIAGVCSGCNLMLMQIVSDGSLTSSNSFKNTIEWAIKNGTQVINWSGQLYSTSTEFDGSCGQIAKNLVDGIGLNDKEKNAHILCSAISRLEENDIALVEASGNYIENKPAFPARETYPISVGGVDSLERIWDERNYGGCPYSTSIQECGSNLGSDFVAPSREILSTTAGNDYQIVRCGDKYNSTDGITKDGYGPCTGTSMAAPLVAGSVGLLRSLHPLLRVSDIKEVLTKTASNGENRNDITGWGIPQIGDAAELILGKSNSIQRNNRLSPVFVLYNNGTNPNPTPSTSTTTAGYYFTPRPQEASAAILGTIYETPDSLDKFPYRSTTAGKAVTGYTDFPSALAEVATNQKQPRAAFSIFANANNPFDSNKLVPLYRLSFSDKACAVRDFIYTTEQAGIDYYTNVDSCAQAGKQTFRLDGIMGYIFPNTHCPSGMVCNDSNTPTNNPNALQCLHRRYNRNKDNWALIMESELGNTEYAGYTEIGTNVSCIGYVFPNTDTDSDGVTNGQELVLGTNTYNKDSDCDGIPDGGEYPVAGLPESDPMDGSCPQPPTTGVDSDDDGMPDSFEDLHNFDKNNPLDSVEDADNDGLSNLQEYIYGTNPFHGDTDGDGTSDFDEVNNGTDPNSVESFTLSNNRWHQISLPSRPPADANTVSSIFGDDGLGTYGTSWVVYRYDSVNNGYVRLLVSDTLSQGIGYWIIQKSGNDKDLDMPDNSTPTPATTSVGCLTDCFEVPLSTRTSTVQWNMIGHPHAAKGSLGDVQVLADDSSACASGCKLDTAKAQGILHNQLWTYTGTNYSAVTTSDNLDPWTGYWAVTLDKADGSNPRLLLPKP